MLNVGDEATFSDPVLQRTRRTDVGTTVQVNGHVVLVSALGDFRVTRSLFQGGNIVQAETLDQAGNVSTLNRRARYAATQSAQGFDRKEKS